MTIEQIRESAKIDISYLYRQLLKDETTKRKERYNQAREDSLSWGILNLKELTRIEYREQGFINAAENL